MAATLTLLKLPFLPQKSSSISPSKLQITSSKQQKHLPNPNGESNPHHKILIQTIDRLNSASLPLATLAFPFFFDSQDALAVNGELGLLEGRTAALIHPLVMGGLFFYTLWAGYLGWQWRRVRTVQDEINELKKEVKPIAITPDGSSPAADLPIQSPIESKIKQLTQERKELVKGQYRDRHFNAGSILLAFGVLESVGGGFNTWFRTGKLFPGPHLYAGAAITVLWAAAAALVPPMQKGNDTARSLHIALNALNVLLFISQIPTGFDILLKVFEFTKWP